MTSKPALADFALIAHAFRTSMEISSQDAFEILFFENITRRDRANSTALELLAGLYSKYGMSKQTLRIDRRLAKLLPENSRVRYNFACSLSLLGRKKEAVAELGKAIELGYDDWDWMKKDPDLKALEGYKGYAAILESIPRLVNSDKADS